MSEKVMSRVEMYKAAIEYVEFEKAKKGSMASFLKQLVEAEEVTEETAPVLGAFIKRNVSKIKFDLSKSEILSKLDQLQKLQTAGQDNAGQLHLTTQIRSILMGTAYFPTDLDDAKNYNGSVEDVRDGMEDSSMPRLSTLAQKLRTQ